jgi:hypothetical protein
MFSWVEVAVRGTAEESPEWRPSIRLALRPELESALQASTHPRRVVDDLFRAASRTYHGFMRRRDGVSVGRTHFVYRVPVCVSLELQVGFAYALQRLPIRLGLLIMAGSQRPSEVPHEATKSNCATAHLERRRLPKTRTHERASVFTSRACCSSVTHSTLR